MSAKTIMFQGTGSSVGKSIMVAALCRILKQDGFSVAPFKSQNMSLNSFVTKDGAEMGRAQVVQAEAAGVDPEVDMNPILLKPEADNRSQVVVLGKPWMKANAKEYYRHTPDLMPVIEKSFNRLCSQYDVIVIEGAGSPAEINLQRFEIVNMAMAELADAPVLLVGDIDKGGVFASLYGTVALLEDNQRAYIKGFIINKFRGDVAILKPGLDSLEQKTGIPVLGVIPYYHDIQINEEDSIHKEEGEAGHTEKAVDIAVIHLPHISNSTDFEPLQQEQNVQLRYVKVSRLLGNPDLIVIPGSKSTMADLNFLKQSGLFQEIINQAARGTPVMGICGGFQMLGGKIVDPKHVESDESAIEGLGLLDMVTTFNQEKTTHQVEVKVISAVGMLRGFNNETLTGYEIHMGQTCLGEAAPAFEINRRSGRPAGNPDGAIGHDGRIFGTYVHGLFDNQFFRRTLLGNLKPGFSSYTKASSLPSRDDQYDKLAELVRGNLDIESIYKIIGI